MRKFYINMYQKGKLNLSHDFYSKFITYEKTKNKEIQIATIDYNLIEESFKKEKKEYEDNGGLGYLSNPISRINNILGIDGSLSSSFRNSLREIKENNKDGYCSFDFSYITKESEKAYYCKELDLWIAKSQTIKKDNILYVKRWIIQNNY